MEAKMAPRWRCDGLLGAQDGQLGSILGAILAHLGHLGANSNENLKKQKTLKNKWFLKVFGWSGGSISAYLEAMLGYVGVSWREVGVS